MPNTACHYVCLHTLDKNRWLIAQFLYNMLKLCLLSNILTIGNKTKIKVAKRTASLNLWLELIAHVYPQTHSYEKTQPTSNYITLDSAAFYLPCSQSKVYFNDKTIVSF